MIEAIIGGVLSGFVNVIQIENADFFYQRALNKKTKQCEWGDKGWSEPKSSNPSLTIFGQTKWIQVCVEKPKSDND